MNQGTIDQRLEEVWMPQLIAAWRRMTGKSGAVDALSAREIGEVAESVYALSRGLVGDRELIGTSYLEDPGRLGAYLLYFWPVSYAQGRQVLAEVPFPLTGRCLDVGGGPGPMAMAAVDAGCEQVHLLERAQGAIMAAQGIARAAGARLTTERVDLQRYQPVEHGQHSLVIAGHSIGELFSRAKEDSEGRAHIERRADLCEGLLGSLTEDGVLVLIEPALRETSRELLEVRDVLVSRGHRILAPCLCEGPCPALERERDWCHSERSWEPPEVVSAIMRAAGLRKESLKMSYLILGGERVVDGLDRSPELFRVVSDALHSKGRFHYIGCGARGRQGITMLKRHKGKALKTFKRLERGDIVRLSALEEKGDGWHVGGESEVERVVRVGEPPATE